MSSDRSDHSDHCDSKYTRMHFVLNLFQDIGRLCERTTAVRLLIQQFFCKKDINRSEYTKVDCWTVIGETSAEDDEEKFKTAYLACGRVLKKKKIMLSCSGRATTRK